MPLSYSREKCTQTAFARCPFKVAHNTLDLPGWYSSSPIMIIKTFSVSNMDTEGTEQSVRIREVSVL